MWATRGVSAEGSVKYWKATSSTTGRQFPVIKVNGAYIHWARYTWEQAYGPVPEGMNVVFKDNDPYHLSLQNLEVISNAELSKRNSNQSSIGLSDNYVSGILTHGQPHLRKLVKSDPALLELKRQQLLLNRTIYEQQKRVS